jgi:hypothetical protein
MKSRKHHHPRRSVHARAEHRAKRRLIQSVLHGRRRACHVALASPPAMSRSASLRHARAFLTYQTEVRYGRTAH